MSALVIPLNGPQRAARAVFACGHTLFLGWGRGVGKSKFLRLMLWSLVAEHEQKVRANALVPFRGVRITVLMPTLKQFKDVHWAGIVEELQGDWAFLGAKLDKQTGQITFPNGSWLKPFPATEYNSRTALGLRTDVLVIDECDSVSCGVYDAVAMPWLSEPWSLAIQIIAGTPNMGRHGLWWRTYQQGILGGKLRAGDVLPREEGETEQARDDRAEALKTIFSFRATYKDAPETVGARAVAKARATTPPATFRREWEADPDAGEGLVYAFDEPFHVRQPPPLHTFREFVVGMDHGDVDPGVLVLIGIQGHGSDATAWALREHYERACPNHIWDQRALEWAQEFRCPFFPDPSRPDRIRTLRSLGIDCRELPAPVKPILAGISRVAEMMFRRVTEDENDWARFYVAPECKNGIRELGLYRRKKHPDGTFDEQPEDKNNHWCDAVRYGLAGRFGLATNTRHVTSGR